MSSNRQLSNVLTIYYTPACHLCEQADVIIQNTLPQGSFQLEWVDIALDETLMQRYGTLIPVLKRQDREGLIAELCWPFDEGKLADFLNN